jgi:hypothetical protein
MFTMSAGDGVCVSVCLYVFVLTSKAIKMKIPIFRFPLPFFLLLSMKMFIALWV